MDEFELLRRARLGEEPPSDQVERLRSKLVAAVEDEMRSGARNRATRVPSGRRGQPVLVGAMALFAVLVASLVIWSSRSANRDASVEAIPHEPRVVGAVSGVAPGPNPYPPSALFDSSTPLLVGGSQVSLDEAAQLSGHPMYRPNLSEDSVQVWVTQFRDDDGVTYDSGLRYGSDLVILYARWPEVGDATQVYTREFNTWSSGYVTTIEGSPAWVIPPTDNSVDPTVSVIHLTIGAWEIELQGRMPVDRLVDLAGTVHP